MVKKIYHHLINDLLYKNSIFLLANNIILAGLGFFFWGINTRLFTAEQIGLASTLISSTTLITVFALLGLNISLVRFLSNSKNKNDQINSSFTIITLASIIMAIIFLIGLKYLSPQLVFIQENLLFATLFVIFVVSSSLSESINNVFRAYRSSEYVLIKNTVFNIFKLMLIFFFVNFGAYGIYSSWMISLVISFVIGLIILTKKFDFQFKLSIKKSVLKKMTFFSFANYISEFFERTPRLVLPIMITGLIGAESTAYYYIAMSVAGFLFLIPEAISSSFFAEGSANEKELGSNTKKVMKAYAMTLLPAILIIVFWGKNILTFFGKDYSLEGFKLLRLLAFSGIFVAINSMFGIIARIKYRMKQLVLINLFGAFVILGLSYLFIPKSLFGVGWAWLIGQGVMNLAYFLTTFWYKS